MSVEEKKSVSFAKKEIIHKYFDDPKNFGEFTVNKGRKHPVRKLDLERYLHDGQEFDGSISTSLDRRGYHRGWSQL